MFPIKKLYDLQELDWKITAEEKSLAQVRYELSDESSLLSAKKVIESIDSKLADTTPQRRQAELDVQKSEDRLQSIEEKLYNGSVNNPKELSALEEERVFLQTQRSDDGDQLLDLMVEIEELQATRNEATANLDSIESQNELEKPQLLESLELHKTHLNDLRQARDKITPQILNTTLSLYESLRKNRKGHALARVERGMCQECRVALPTMDLQKAKFSQSMVQCNSCSRILFVM